MFGLSDNQLKRFFGVQAVVSRPIDWNLRISYEWSISHLLPRANVLYAVLRKTWEEFESSQRS